MTQAEFDAIERYLNGDPATDFGRLSEGKTPAEINALKDRIEAQREIQLAVGTSNLRAEMQRLHAARWNDVDDASPRRNAYWLYLIIVLLLALAGLAYYFWSSDSGQNKAPYAKYEYQDPGLPSRMGLSDDPAFSTAMRHFKRGDYVAARTALEGIDAPPNDTLTYYRGASAYYADDYLAAVPAFDSVANTATSLFRQRAEYLLALSYLKAGQVEAAKEELQGIGAQPDHAFSRLARQILTEGVP
jgi:hypothetical protein